MTGGSFEFPLHQPQVGAHDEVPVVRVSPERYPTGAPATREGPVHG